MARHLSILLLLVLLTGCAVQGRGGHSGPPHGEPPWARNGGASASTVASTLEEMLRKDDFDLPRALLMFSARYADEFPQSRGTELDVESVLRRFDAYVQELRRSLRRDRSPRQRLLTLIEFVHSKLGLRFDASDPKGHNPQNLFFDQVINRRLGYCVTLSLAYVVFGQAAGLDVRGVRIPGHFAAQFAEGHGEEKYEALIESTTGGALLDPIQVWTKHRFSKQAVDAGIYLTPINNREIFSTLYNNLAGLTHLRGDDKLAVERYTRALELAPNHAEALYNRALVQRRLGQARPALRDLNEALRLDPNFTLGLVARSGVLWEAGEKTPAREDLAAAMRQRPEWPEPWLLDAAFAAQEGQLKEARASYLRALELDPKIAEAHRALARIARLLGDDKAAREHDEAARRLSQ